MKRWIVLLLLAAVVLAGCSAKNSTAQDYVSSPAAGAESGTVSSAGDLALAGEGELTVTGVELSDGGTLRVYLEWHGQTLAVTVETGGT